MLLAGNLKIKLSRVAPDVHRFHHSSNTSWKVEKGSDRKKYDPSSE